MHFVIYFINLSNLMTKIILQYTCMGTHLEDAKWLQLKGLYHLGLCLICDCLTL